MHMKILGVSLAVLAVGVAMGAPRVVSLSPLGGGTTSAPADEGETVKVQGRGVGLTKEAALKDAYRDAIERAVGLYVDAETAANNDQIVKDQVLTQSNAYIKDYRELDSCQIEGGLVQLRILATVQKRALTTKLSGVMPAQTVNLNNTGLQNVHAQLVTKEKRAEDAAALLKNALDGINPMKSLMVANIRPETQKIVTADDNSGASMKVRRGRGPGGSRATADSSTSSVILRYLFEVKLDREKYFAEFVPNLKKVLDQISLQPPKEIRLTELMPALGDSSNANRAKSLQEFFAGAGERNSVDHGDANIRSDGISGLFGRFLSGDGSATTYFDPLHVYSIQWQGDNWVWQFGRYQYCPKAGGAFSWKTVPLRCAGFDGHYRKDKVYFALITSLNATGSNGKVTIYELDKSVIPVLDEWRKGLVDKDKYGNEQKTTNYNIVLLDKDGEELGVYPWQIPNGLLINMKFAEIPAAGMVYCAPFVGCFGENLLQWRDFVLEKDALAKIASMKIELAD